MLPSLRGFSGRTCDNRVKGELDVLPARGLAPRPCSHGTWQIPISARNLAVQAAPTMKPRPSPSLILGTALLCGACICAPVVPRHALAGAVYRCTGANGQTAFTNKPGSYNGCKKMTDYADPPAPKACLLYTSDAADERSSVDLGGRRII